MAEYTYSFVKGLLREMEKYLRETCPESPEDVDYSHLAGFLKKTPYREVNGTLCQRIIEKQLRKP